MNGLLGVHHLTRGLLSQPQRMGARTQSRNILGINHPLAESSPVARIPISMMPFIGGPVSGYTQEDLATLKLPEETTLFSPLGYDITDKDLAKFGLATDTMDWIPGAAIVGGAATAAQLLGRALKGADYAPTSMDDLGSALLGQSLQRQGALDEAMVGGEVGAAALARIGNTAPQRAMELAEQMESAGRSRDEIWAATADMGYPVYRGPDGKLRFEIDDSAVRFKEAPVGKSRADLAGDYFESKGVPRTKRATGQYPELDDEALDWADANRQSNPTVPVYESIIHPEMQQAYPDSGVRIGRVDPGTRDLSGYFDPATKEIRYGGGAIMDTDNAGTALHELQHVTQEAEGFARGGNPKFASGMDEAAQFEAARRAYNSANFSADGLTDDVLLHELTGRPMPSQPPKAWDELSRKEQVKWLEAGRYDMYRALAGEAEARQVQARMDMTPAERAYKPFYADFDVPEADQIVRYGDSPSAMVAYHKADRPTLEEFTRSQRPSKKIKHGSMAQALRKEIKAKKDARRDLKYSNRDRLSPNIDQRLQWHKDSKQKAAAAEKTENRIESAGGLWNARFSNEIREASNYSLGATGLSREVREAISRANMEAVPRQLKKLGWSMRHSSAGRGGRKSSRYILSPDKKYEVRLSDHYLPDTPQRADTIARGGHGWTDEIVLDGDESPQELIDAIQRAARSDGSWNAVDVLGGYADESVDDLARRAKVLKRNDEKLGVSK